MVQSTWSTELGALKMPLGSVMSASCELGLDFYWPICAWDHLSGWLTVRLNPQHSGQVVITWSEIWPQEGLVLANIFLWKCYLWSLSDSALLSELATGCVDFGPLQRDSTAGKVRRWLCLALSSLFGANSDPQLWLPLLDLGVGGNSCYNYYLTE